MNLEIVAPRVFVTGIELFPVGKFVTKNSTSDTFMLSFVNRDQGNDIHLPVSPVSEMLSSVRCSATGTKGL